MDCRPARVLEKTPCVLSFPSILIESVNGVLGIHVILLPLLGLAAALLAFMLSPWFLLASVFFFGLWGIAFLRYMFTGR
jgi:hypothetical protein